MHSDRNEKHKTYGSWSWDLLRFWEVFGFLHIPSPCSPSACSFCNGVLLGTMFFDKPCYWGPFSEVAQICILRVHISSMPRSSICIPNTARNTPVFTIQAAELTPRLSSISQSSFDTARSDPSHRFRSSKRLQKDVPFNNESHGMRAIQRARACPGLASHVRRWPVLGHWEPEALEGAVGSEKAQKMLGDLLEAIPIGLQAIPNGLEAIASRLEATATSY